MSTVPTGPAGDVTVMDVALATAKLPVVVPNLTALTAVKPVPVIVTEVNPTDRPATGLTAVTVGAAMYVNWSEVLVALVAPAVVTVMSTGPALRSAGDVAVIEVDELTLKTATAEPKRTALALGEPVPEKPVPVMVTDVPPARGPAAGVTAVTVGAAT